MIGGFQTGPFQTDYQQVPTGGGLPDFTGVQWYLASDNIFEAGYLQVPMPIFIKTKLFAPGIVVGQLPLPGTIVPPRASLQLYVATDNLLSAAFDLIIHKVSN